MTGLRWTPFGIRPLDVVRWGAGVTLIWASAEKWAYPQWTAPIAAANPGMTLGTNFSTFMVAAGIIEFSLALGLLWTPLVRRFSAIALTFLFCGAVLDFGKIDAIGHMMIVVILIAIICDDDRRTKLPVWHAPLAYAAALLIVIGAYHGLHDVLYGPAVRHLIALAPR
jgi:hypothetical protein